MRFAWEEETTEMALCGNTCVAANNGVCDEGRLADYSAVPAAGLPVLCDPGTDCADCGPFKFNATGGDASYQADLPIKRLTSSKVLLPAVDASQGMAHMQRSAAHHNSSQEWVRDIPLGTQFDTLVCMQT